MFSKRIVFTLSILALLFLSGIATSYASTIFLNDDLLLDENNTSLPVNQLNTHEIEVDPQDLEILDQPTNEASSDNSNGSDISEPLPPSFSGDDSYFQPLPESAFSWTAADFGFFDVYFDLDALNYSDYTFAIVIHQGVWSWEWITVDQFHLSFNTAPEIIIYSCGYEASWLWLETENFADSSNLKLTVLLVTNDHIFFDTLLPINSNRQYGILHKLKILLFNVS